jgi:uncharacterized protein
VDKARQMTQEVLRNHPKSAKAHFVMAELDAAQGRAAEAKGELSQAETLAPGLPFARPEAVQALRTRLSAKPALSSAGSESSAVAAAAVREAPRSQSFPWGWILLGAVGIAVVATLMRSRAAARSAPAYPQNNYGAPSAGDWGRQPPGSGPPPGYGPQPYGPAPAQPGMGGNIMGGLATGLAIGAGALAAEEIGRRMLGSHDQHNLASGSAGPVAHPQSDSSLAQDAGIGDIDRLAGGGGGTALPDDFGINDADAGSWDDGGSFGGADGGGWDS